MKSTITSTDFQARCLVLLDEMEQRGEPIIVTRRGRPVAVLGPAPKDAWQSPANSWTRKGKILGDIVNTSADTQWEAAEN